MAVHAVALLWIVDREASERLRPAHLEYIHELRRQGKVVNAGRFMDGSGGMVIFSVDSLDEARALVLEDPVVKAGARRFQLLEWHPMFDVGGPA